MKAKTLYIHAGLPKTGSTFLQRVFAENAGVLRTHDILYPDRHPRQVYDLLFSGHLDKVYGNGVLPQDETKSDNDDGQQNASLSLLLSNEVFVGHALNIEEYSKEKLLKYAELAGFENIKMLVFLRNPVSHCASVWQQMVKMSQCVASVNYFSTVYKAPKKINMFLDLWQDVPNVEIEVYNHSVIRKDLLRYVEKWLDIPEGLFVRPTQSKVNRSLTRSELRLLRGFHSELAKSNFFNGKGLKFGQKLSKTLPNIKPEKIVPSKAAQENMWERLGPEIANVNARIDPSQKYEFDVQDDGSDTERHNYNLSEEQVKVIINTFGEQATNLRSNALRRVAQKHVEYGDFPAAITNFHEAIALSPRNAGAYKDLIAVLQKKKRLGEAIKITKRAVEEFPLNKGFEVILAKLQLRAGDFAASEATYRRYIDACPDDPKGYNGMSIVLKRQERFDEADAAKTMAETLA